MADGKTHALATQTLAVLLFAAEATNGKLQNYPLVPTLIYCSALSVGALLGLILTPDLDVNAGSISEDQVREMSPFGENLWWIYWFPYRQVLPHRSPFSHWPVIGTIVRLFYLGIPYFLALTFFYFAYPPYYTWLAQAGFWLITLPYSHVALLGLMSADMLHFFMDRRIFHRVFRQSRAMMMKNKEDGYMRYD